MNTKYESQRVLNELDKHRESDDWAGDTAVFPRLAPLASDETVPMIPALLRPQAE